MKKLLILFLLLPALVHSQQSMTFQIEELEPPKERLRLTHINSFYERILRDKHNISFIDLEKGTATFAYNIVAQSNSTDSIAGYGATTMFTSMYQAYADHRPFVLSPDMMWLLISQGFANHVKYNSEKLRPHFVNFDGKLSLIVRDNTIDLNDPNSPWEDVFPQFTKQIGKYAGEDLAKVMTADFSTTTSASKVASEATLMKAMEDYFEYIVIYAVCGIPEITLEGTPEDWQKVLDKARFLKKYELNWWINEIEPVLEKIVKTAEGKIDKTFWQQMFKYHTQEVYGRARVFDGWIVKFYPYDNNGKRYNLKEIDNTFNLPHDIVSMDIKYIEVDKDGNQKEPIMLELWAGFTGFSQNEETLALKPEIGWMIRNKEKDDAARKNKLETDDTKESFRGIRIRVDRVPKEILEMEKINDLSLDFIGKINIPDEMANIPINKMTLNGEISESEIERICKMFPNTLLTINRKKYFNLHLKDQQK